MKAILYLFLLSITLRSSCTASSTLQNTCKQVVDSEHYDFCVKALSSDSESDGVDDSKDLARVAAEYALERFKKTNKKIEKMSKKDGVTEKQALALDICRDSYNMGHSKLEMVIPYYEKGGLEQATNYIYATLDKLQSCIDAFVKTGVQSSLAKENDEAVGLVRLISKLMV